MSEKELRLFSHSVDFAIKSTTLCSCDQIAGEHWRLEINLDAEVEREDLARVFNEISELDRTEQTFKAVMKDKEPPPNWDWEITIKKRNRS